jgi:hypothetical protein
MKNVILVDSRQEKIILVLHGIFFYANSKESHSTNLSNQALARPNRGFNFG